MSMDKQPPQQDFPTADDAALQPSDAFFARWLARSESPSMARSDLPQHILEMMYRAERLLAWLDEQTEPSLATAADLTQMRDKVTFPAAATTLTDGTRLLLYGGYPLVYEGQLRRLKDCVSEVPEWVTRAFREMPPQIIEPPAVPGPQEQNPEQNPEQEPHPKSPVYRLPRLVPYSTFAEVKAVAMASADGPRGRGWIDIPSEPALWHTREKDAPLQIQYTVGPLVQWLGSPATHAALRAELPKMGLAANLALHACVNSLLGPESQATIDLDDLVATSGMVPRSRAERIEMRSRVWHWLVVFSCWQAVGQRKGTYKDPDTHQVQDLRSEVPLFHIDERGYPTGAQVSPEESRVPVRVTILRGAWLRRWASDARVVSYFGTVSKLSTLPGGQTSGAWGQSIGMATLQFWREESSRVAVVPVGDEQTLTARFKPRTRRELLDLFPPDPTVDEILGSDHPRRACQYWKSAVADLRRIGHLAYYHELGTVAQGRQGWAQAWLNQKIEMRPGPDVTHDAAAMAARAEAGRKARTRKRRV